MEKFYYLSTTEKEIEGKNFIVIYVLAFKAKCVFRIYKLKDTNSMNLTKDLKIFDDISSRITYAIKSGGKVTLDIK